MRIIVAIVIVVAFNICFNLIHFQGKFVVPWRSRGAGRWLSQLVSTWVNTGSLVDCVFYSIQFANSTAIY